MHAWEAIQNSVDYIENHLQEDIRAEALSKMTGLSPFYFQRLFRRLVNKPLQEYVKMRRLARAAEELKSKNPRILDVALDYGFSSHGNFTRAFKETYGITPEEYKKAQPLLNTFRKPEIAANYITVDEGVPLIVGNMVLEIRRERLQASETYLGLSTEVPIAGQTPMGESTGIDLPGQLWVRYHREKTALEQYLSPHGEMGMSYAADPEKGTFSYFAGGSVKTIPVQIPDCFVRCELPEGEYIVCSIEAENFEELAGAALDQASRYLFGTWLPKHQLATLPFSAEKYDIASPEVNRMELWVAPQSVTDQKA